MARRGTIYQKIALEGAEEILRQLNLLGAAGRKAAEGLQQATAGTGKPAQDVVNNFRAAKEQVETFAKSLSGIGASVARNVGPALRLAGIGATTFGAAVATIPSVLLSLASGQAKAAQETNQLAQSFGLTLEVFQQFRFAADQIGIPIANLQSAFGRLSQNMTQLASGADGVTNILSEMKISVRDTAGDLLSTEQVFFQIADAFQGMEDGADKTSKAAALFGLRAGPALIPLLNKGREGIREYAAEFDRLGGGFSDLDVKVGTALRAAQSAIGTAVAAIRRDVGLAFGPQLTVILNNFANGIAQLREPLTAIAEFIAGTVLQAIADFSSALAGDDSAPLWAQGVAAAFQSVGQVIVIVFELIRSVVRSISAALDVVAGVINKVFGTNLTGNQLLVLALFTKILGVIRVLQLAFVIAAAAVEQFIGIFKSVAAFIERTSAAVSGFIRSFVGGAEEAGKAWDDAGERVDDATSDMTKSAETAGKAVTDSSSKAGEAIGKNISTGSDIATASVTEIQSSAETMAQRVGRILANVIAQARRAAAAVAAAAGGGGGGGGGANAFAGGGMIRGPGTGTSDSIPIWASNREFMIRAAAVRKYGSGLFDMLNKMRLPKDFMRGFNMGGLVNVQPRPTPAFAGFARGGPVNASGGRPLTLVVGGEKFEGLTAPDDTAAQMSRFALGQQVRSNGRQPRWRK